MNQEIEYAEMLEIPVSTINVVHKKRRKKETSNRANPTQPSANVSLPAQTQAPNPMPLKDTVIAQVNERVGEEIANRETAYSENTDAPAQPNQEESVVNTENVRFDPIPERIDTVRLYADGETPEFSNNPVSYYQNQENKKENAGTVYALNNEKQPPKAARIALGIEFAAVCALCGAIFVTNVFIPNSAINTFFRGMTGAEKAETTNSRVYSDFELASIVGDFSDVTLTLSDAGVLSLTDQCFIYPAADGEVAEITQNSDGIYTMKIRYSDSFTGIFNGLHQVYYAEGDEVKTNVPVAYSNGETEVQVTMYSSGMPLNCFVLTEENCLAWVEEN